MRIALLSFLLVGSLSINSFAQSESKAPLEWLKSHLNYSYRNHDQGKWWINKFEYNDQGVVHFQNTSTENPAKFSGKSWIDRRVRWIDLDPYSISITNVAEDQGRIVAGKVLKVNVINNQRKIRKLLDGKPATAENFLQIAIPRQILDTAAYFPDSLKWNLVQAIESNSRIGPTGTPEDIEAVFNVLRGDFLFDNYTRTYTRTFPDRIEYVDKLGAKPVAKGFFGRQEENEFVEMRMSEQGFETYHYQLVSSDNVLKLVCREVPSRIIEIPSLHHFNLNSDGPDKEFRRISYR